MRRVPPRTLRRLSADTAEEGEARGGGGGGEEFDGEVAGREGGCVRVGAEGAEGQGMWGWEDLGVAVWRGRGKGGRGFPASSPTEGLHPVRN